jgi:hypothetical protein
MGVAKAFQAAIPTLWRSSTPQAKLVAAWGEAPARRNRKILQVFDFMRYFKNQRSSFEKFLCTGVC